MASQPDQISQHRLEKSQAPSKTKQQTQQWGLKLQDFWDRKVTGFWQKSETFGRGGREWGCVLLSAPTCCRCCSLLCKEPLLLLPQPLHLSLVVPLQLLHHLLV